MTGIWKYELEITDCQILKITKGAVPLTIQMQNGIPCLWCRVDPEMKQKYKQYIFCVGTGRAIPGLPYPKYIGTVQIGAFVWHYFWELPGG